MKIIWVALLVAGAVLTSRAELTVTVYPGKVFAPGEIPTTDKLNLLGLPTIDITGTISGTNAIAAQTITGTHLNDNIVDGTNITFNTAAPRALTFSTNSVSIQHLRSEVAGDGLTGGSNAPLSVVTDNVTLTNDGTIKFNPEWAGGLGSLTNFNTNDFVIEDETLSLNVQTRVAWFTNDTTWTAPGGVTSVWVTAWGGGGGGGGGDNTGAGQGGGGGAWAEGPVTVIPGTNYTVDVGAGGLGGAGGDAPNRFDGASGEPTQFLIGTNVVFSVGGGAGGTMGSPTGSSTLPDGIGGTTTNFFIWRQGANGADGNATIGGTGAPAIETDAGGGGVAGESGVDDGDGGDGTQYSAGGGGGAGSGTSRNGGDGLHGIIMLQW